MLQAAADWTGVLINMNKDTVDSSLQTLHEGTVGQLNADFETIVEPYSELVQTLRAKTTGQIDSVAIESLHHDQPDATRRTAAARTVGVVGLTHRHGDGGRDVGQRERGQRQAADRALERCGSDVSDVDGKLLDLRLEPIR